MKKRLQTISEVVNQYGEVSIHELKELFPTVSEVTLRKDLQVLDETKKLVRIHGGARSLNRASVFSNDFSSRRLLHQKEKNEIGEKAAKLLSRNMSVFISAGSTCLELAKHLPNEELNIFTDGILVSISTPMFPSLSVELLGGEVNQNLMRVTGPNVLSELEQLHFDIIFLGTMGFNQKYGFPVSTPIIFSAYNKAIERSEKTVILMDSSKLNDLSLPRNIPFEKVDIVVTDDKIPESIKHFLEEKNIQVL